MANQLRRVAAQYTVPMTSGRGYSSLPPRKEMVDRFRRSGRENLVAIVVSDFDPEGEDIPGSFGISLRDDFGVDGEQLHIVKAALTAAQVQTMDLHEGQLSKESSSLHRRFVGAHGERAWKLESLTADQLPEIVEAALQDVLDLDAFEMEVERERLEQRKLEAKFLGTDVQGGLTDPEAVPAPPDEAVTQPGDVWLRGEHRLLCGDSASRGDVGRLLDGARIHLVNTDPPYNVKVEPLSNDVVAAGGSRWPRCTSPAGLLQLMGRNDRQPGADPRCPQGGHHATAPCLGPVRTHPRPGRLRPHLPAVSETRSSSRRLTSTRPAFHN